MFLDYIMVKSFLIQRFGNKKNDIKNFDHLLPFDIKNIIEPFGGSFAVTREKYMDKKYNRYVNDNDDVLYSLYKEPELYMKSLKKFHDICGDNLILFEKINKYYPDTKIVLDEFKKDKNKFTDMIINNRNMRGTIKHYKNFPDYNDSLKIMKKINFTNDDWEIVINKWKNKKDTFLFLDPPYLFSNNKFYDQQFNNDSDCSDIIIKILNILKDPKTKAKIMLVINNLKIIKLLFSDYIKLEYEKIYQMAKRKDSHIVICNYDL